MSPEPFNIEYAHEAVNDLKSLREYDRTKVMDGIDTHLRHEPTKASRSRIKEMAQPFWSKYRLRVEDFRVYYDVGEENRVVTILRVLDKRSGETPKGS